MKSEATDAAGKAGLDPLVLRALALDGALIEIGRKAIEIALVDCREHRISQPFRGNGLGIKEKDGKDMYVMIRMGPDDGLRIGLNAIADHLEHNASVTGAAVTDTGRRWSGTLNQKGGG